MISRAVSLSVALPLMSLSACASTSSPSQAGDATTAEEATDATGLDTADASFVDIVINVDVAIDEAPDTAHVPPALPDPPSLACSDAGAVDATLADASDIDSATIPLDPSCPLPASVCASAPNWLVYFDGGSCVAGSCHFTAHALWCDYGCYGGRCESGFTH